MRRWHAELGGPHLAVIPDARPQSPAPAEVNLLHPARRLLRLRPRITLPILVILLRLPRAGQASDAAETAKERSWPVLVFFRDGPVHLPMVAWRMEQLLLLACTAHFACSFAMRRVSNEFPFDFL